MDAMNWAGVALVLAAVAVSTGVGMIVALEKALAWRDRARRLERALQGARIMEQDLLSRLDQLDPIDDAFVNQVLDLAMEDGVTGVSGYTDDEGHHVTKHYEDGHSEATILQFPQVGDLEL